VISERRNISADGALDRRAVLKTLAAGVSAIRDGGAIAGYEHA
jgi:hypothetical protein